MEFRWIEWNLAKVALHGVSPTEAEYVVERARTPFPRWSADDRLLVWGAAPGGRYLQVVYLLDDDGTVFVIHARPLTRRECGRLRRQRRKRSS